MAVHEPNQLMLFDKLRAASGTMSVGRIGAKNEIEQTPALMLKFFGTQFVGSNNDGYMRVESEFEVAFLHGQIAPFIETVMQEALLLFHQMGVSGVDIDGVDTSGYDE